MKITPLSFAFIVLGCSPGSKEVTSGTDSTKVSIDSAVVVKPPVLPPIDAAELSSLNFPAYSGEVFTEDEHEAAVTRGLVALMGQHETEKVVRVKGNYTITYLAANDYDDSKSKAVISETKTWYFSPERLLRAYVSAHTSDTDSTTTIYLFDKGKLTGAYQDYFYRGQDSGVIRGRELASQCPKCGVELKLDTQPPITIQDETNFSDRTTAFFKDYNEMLSDLKAVTVTKTKDNDNLLTIQKQLGDKPYSLNYTVNKSIYQKLLRVN